MNLSGHTRPYAVLGHPIGHTLSPVMHNASFRSLGLDAIYLAFDVAPDRLAAVLPAMAAMGFGGVNLTVPLKETAFRLLDDLDESARMTGSVNTVEFTERGLRGHSTDGPGFLLALQEAFHCGPCGDTVFVLGCGGAGRAVAMACAGAGAARLRLADADATRAQALAEDMAAWSPQTDVQALSAASEVWAQASHLSDLVVQATPAGMKPGDRSPLAAAAFRDGQRVFDLIYMQPETPCMQAARAGGAQAANGLGMLLHQGARSFTIWTGDMPDLGAMRHALETSVYGKQDTSEPL
jgi:shikimate dehydrogenase